MLAGRTVGHVGGSTAQKGTKLEATGELDSVLRAQAEPHRGAFHDSMAAFSNKTESIFASEEKVT